MKIGIVFKDGNKKAEKLAGEITEFLRAKKCDVAGEKNLDGAQYVLVLGGDGTLIHKAGCLAHLGIPFIGINIGNLGFLTAAESDDWKDAVSWVVDGRVIVSERITLEAKIKGKGTILRAINEFVIKGQFRVVDLDIKVSGKELLSVYGDGVIIASQSGSTAYSLSAGGPVVDGDLNCLLITPINPIGLPVGSVVVSAQDEVVVKVMRGDDVYLVVDGQKNLALSVQDEIIVRRAKDTVKFGYFDKHHFIKSLNAKFGLTKRRVV